MAGGTEQMSNLIRAARREQIAEVAGQLFMERGTFEVSVDEIAARAELSRSTVYNHFADREEILRAALERGHAALVVALEAALAEVADPIERLVALFRVVIEQVDHNAGFYRLAMSLAASRDGGEAATVSAEILVVTAEVGDLLEAALQDAARTGLVRDDVAASALVSLAGRQLSGLLSERMSQMRPRSPDETARETWQLLLEGVGA